MPSQSNPGAVAAMFTGAAVALVPAIVAGPVLGLLGFGAAGVAADQSQMALIFVMHR